MINSIIHGDNMITMKEMEDNSIDLGLTDPPYGLSKAKPDENIIKEAIGSFLPCVLS